MQISAITIVFLVIVLLFCFCVAKIKKQSNQKKRIVRRSLQIS